MCIIQSHDSLKNLALEKACMGIQHLQVTYSESLLEAQMLLKTWKLWELEAEGVKGKGACRVNASVYFTLNRFP